VIRRSFAERETKELFKRQSVVDLILQIGIGINVETLLEEQAFIE
jgi:hypothetical protein